VAARRDRRAVRIEEAEPPAGGVTDAHSRRGGDTEGCPTFAQGERGILLEDVASRQSSVDVQRPAEPPRSTARVAGQSAGGQRLGGPDEHTPGDPRSIHRQVEAVVHPVDEVDVEGPGLPPKWVRPPRAAAKCMSGRITRTQVGLGLHDARGTGPAGIPAHQHLANQPARGLDGRGAKQGAESSPLAGPGGVFEGGHAGQYSRRPARRDVLPGRLVVEVSGVSPAPDDAHGNRAYDKPGQHDHRHGGQQVPGQEQIPHQIVLHPRTPGLPREAVTRHSRPDVSARRTPPVESGGGTAPGPNRPELQLEYLGGACRLQQYHVFQSAPIPRP
jgi:hypothetical protein